MGWKWSKRPKAYDILELDFQPNDGSPFTAGGTLSGVTAAVLTTDYKVIDGAAVGIGGNNTSGSDKTATGSIFFGYAAQTQFRLESHLRCPISNSSYVNFGVKWDIYDGAKVYEYQFRYQSNKNATNQWQYKNASDVWTSAGLSTAADLASSIWGKLLLEVNISDDKFSYVSLNGQTATGLTVKEAASVGKRYMQIQYFVEYATGVNEHLLVDALLLSALN